jgi:hypothetical protein
MSILDPMQSGLPITILWLGGSLLFAYAIFGGKK